MDSVYIPVALVTAGAAIMVINIFRYFLLTREISNAHLPSKRGVRGLLFLYICLLVFFLCGYLGVDLMFFVPGWQVHELLVGMILFFGSIFVLIGIILQTYLTRAIQSSNVKIIRALVGAVEARDANLNGHSIHVAKLVMLFYTYLPVRLQLEMNRTELEYAALLHDVGKLGIPESVLNKKGRLSTEEWTLIKNHPLIGKNILEPIDCFDRMPEWVLYHHERLDGKGYYLLDGKDIPLASRLIAIADTYSAITMSRSYREAQSYERAVEIVKESAGTQLDTELCGIFLAIPKEQVLACMDNIGGDQYGMDNQK